MLVIPPPNAVHRRNGGDRTIVRALWTSALLVTLCTLALSAAVLFFFYERYERSHGNVEDVEYYRVVLNAATALAAERGPANSAMGEQSAGMEKQLQRLADARRLTDVTLQAMISPPDGEEEHTVPPSLLEALRLRIAHARQNVDVAVARQLPARSYADIQTAIDSMMAASDTMDDNLRWLGRSLIAEDADLATPVLAGLILSELRDYTGRVASHVMAPIIAREQMPLRNQIESRITRGRVLELWRLLEITSAAYPGSEAIAAKRQLFEKRFFGEGLRLVDRAIEEGTGKIAYSKTAGELSRDYVPTLHPVEEVREAFLDAAIKALCEKEQHARYMLAAVAAGTFIVILFMIGMAAAVQVFLFGPLFRASSIVIDLAEGRALQHPPKPWRGAEMRRLFKALEILSGRMGEWAALVSRLQTEVDTDGMTGLMNRAAFDRLVQGKGTLAGNCLVLIDIDHFKSINDRFGHPAGDNVIRHIGNLLRAELGHMHVAARYGGEEFAILYRGDLTASTAHCERLRAGIAVMPVHFDETVLPSVTASFGIAAFRGDKPKDLVSRADAALYRAKNDGRNRVCIGI